MTRIEWTGMDRMIQAVERHTATVNFAIRMVAKYWEPVLESYAKDNAPWTDRTGNARGGLHAYTEELAADTVALYLAHKMDYGVGLELKFQGKYAIIMPTLEAHYGEIMQRLREVFR